MADEDFASLIFYKGTKVCGEGKFNNSVGRLGTYEKNTENDSRCSRECEF